jgi:hypothetical protein
MREKRYYGGIVGEPESGDGEMESDRRGSASDSRRQGKKKELILDCDMSVKLLGVGPNLLAAPNHWRLVN